MTRISYLTVITGIALTLLATTVQAQLRLSGLSDDEQARLKSHLSAYSLECDLNDAAARRQRARLEADLDAGLHALGYFNAHWQSQLEFKDGCWLMSVEIEPGAVTLIAEVDIRIEGAAAVDTNFQSLIDRSGLVVGKKFNTSAYDSLKSAISARGLRLGYLDAGFSQQQVDIYPDLNEARIHLHWNSGDRYHIGELRIDQDVIRDKLFTELLTTQSGDLYDLNVIQNDRVRLTESHYFDKVEILPLLNDAENQQVPLEISATEGRVHSYQVGVGFSTDTGPRFRGDYSRYRINKAGHQADIKLLVSQVLTTVNTNYRIPWNDPRTDSINLQLGFINENTDSYTSHRWESGISFSEALTSRWTMSRSLTLINEESDVAGEVDTSLHLIPAISWHYLKSDDPINPTSGHSLTLTLSASHQDLLSDTSFLQADLALKHIQPLNQRWSLVSRGEAGFTWADSIDDLPASVRFFTGGDDSIRGYDYQALGPREDDQPIGGLYMLVGSVELQYKLKERWSLATFIDGGNSWNSDQFKPAYGYGIGLRWRSPIGPLRVDLGIPQDKDYGKYRLHLTIGPPL